MNRAGTHTSATRFTNEQGFLKKMARASRQAYQAALQQLQADYRQAQKDFARREIEKLRAEDERNVDLKVIELYTQLPEELIDERTNVVHRQMGELLGCLPTDDHGSVLRAKDKSFLTLTGHLSREKSRLKFGYLTFHDLYHGAPTLVAWLHSQGCRDFKYEFSYPSLGELLEDEAD